MSLRIYYGSDLVAQGFSSTNGTIMDSNTAYYEIMPGQSGGYSIQEWTVNYNNNPAWTSSVAAPFPASSSSTYSSEADMLSQFNTAGVSPVYSQTHSIIGTYDLTVSELNTLVGNNYHGLSADDYMVEQIVDSMTGTSYEIRPATWNSGNNAWEATGNSSTPLNGVTTPGDLTGYTQSSSPQSSSTSSTTTSSTTTTLDVYDLLENEAGTHPSGKYALEPQYSPPAATLTGYRLTPVELDTTTSTIHDDYITVANPTHVDITISDWTSANLTSADIVGTFTITNAGNTGNTGNAGNAGSTGGYHGNANQITLTEFGDRVQVNVATSSTNTISSMINAMGGMDSLHLNGTHMSSVSSEDLEVSSDDSQITSAMLTNFGSGEFSAGNNYAEINLGNNLSGPVHVWTQTPEFYQGIEPFNAVLGILDKDTDELVASNDDGFPTTGYSSQAINDLVTANNSTRSSSDSFLSFTATDTTNYSVIVGDLNQSNSSTQFGGLFDLYAVTGIGAAETLLLSETNIDQSNGVFVDFSDGVQGELQSAWVTSFGGNGGSVGFSINNFEKIELTDFDDYMIVTEYVGVGVGQSQNSASYFSTSQSGMLIDPGTAIGGIDRLDVHKNSHLYISYEESSQNSSGDGINVNIGNSSVTVQGGDVDTLISGYDGTGLLVDYLETTNFDDTVVNNGSVGMIVNVAKNYDATDFDYFTGTNVSTQVDVLDARMNNSLEFSTYDEYSNGTSLWTEISGYSELKPYVDGDTVYALTSTHGVGHSGNYVIRHDAGTYYATEVSGNATNGYYFNGYSEQSTSLTDITGLTDVGNMPAPVATETRARIKDVEMILVRDGNIQGITDDDQIWSQLSSADVDIYVDMSHIYGPTSQQISGLGTGTIDNFGAGYDVQTSAQVDSFGNDTALPVYYDGNHEDFTDTSEQIDTSTPGAWELTNGDTTNGSGWATEVAAATNGGGGSFFIVVGGKKIAVKHSNNEWIADNTALSIAQGVSMGDTSASTIDTNYVSNTNYTTNEEGFIADIVDRYGLPKLADSTNYSFSNDIYLNATEQQITEVLDNSGTLTSEKAFNFGFYTKVLIGDSTINLKITQPDSANYPHLFELNPDDVDLMVESIYNRVETTGQSVDSGSEAGNFVKIDDVDDIAMGNGGDDTYVIDTAGNGTVLEYGDINTTVGGLDNSENDSVNFANISSIDQLVLSRGTVKNEDTDNTLLVGTAGSTTDKSVIFDNFNEYLDFRRVEFLTIDDASNNNEIFEISFGDNSGTDGSTAKDLAWDNEIVVADNQGDIIYADAGTDVLVGGDGNDTFNLANVVSGSTHETMSHVYIKNISSGDSITLASGGDYSGNTVTDDGYIEVSTGGGNSYMIFTDDETTLTSYLDAATIV